MQRWLDLYLGGQRWGVYVVSPRSKYLKDDEGTLYAGRCVYDRCRIYLSKELEGSAKEDALLHELLHALLHVSGASAAYNHAFKADELLVSSLTPVLHRLLKDFGFEFPR